MTIRSLLLVMFFGLLAANYAFGKPIYRVKDPSRVVTIIGQVDGSIIDEAARIDKLSRASNAPIYMLINSPGGSVNFGSLFIDSMNAAKTRGVKFYCATQLLAASMAFAILDACDYRYAVPHARLLFHPVSVSVQGAGVMLLLPIIREIVQEERQSMNALHRSLGMPRGQFLQAYFSETFWQADRLAVNSRRGWLRLVDSIEGFGDKLYQYRKPAPRLMFNTNSTAERILQRYEEGK